MSHGGWFVKRCAVWQTMRRQLIGLLKDRLICATVCDLKQPSGRLRAGHLLHRVSGKLHRVSGKLRMRTNMRVCNVLDSKL